MAIHMLVNYSSKGMVNHTLLHGLTLDSLVNGPIVKVSDVKGLVDLSEDMQKCELTLSKLGYMSDVNSTQTIRSIVKRLPNPH